MKKTHAISKLINTLNHKSEPFLFDRNSSYEKLVDQIGDARFILIGESTHGTHEFYQIRAELSKKLIEEKGFMAITIEGDWPDVYPIDRYVKSIDKDQDPSTCLLKFTRFPRWMWRNTVIPPFINWLRQHNEKLELKNKVGFYGLDLYSLNASMQEVVTYLNSIDPDAAKRAQERYACFNHLSFDPDEYGYLISAGLKEACIQKAVEQLVELQHNAMKYLTLDGISAEDEYFYATQNARLVKNAESYYRAHFEGRVSSWNIRDRHMAQTFNVLVNHLENRFQKPAKLIVWAHNSHVGDARATDMASVGEINIGQILREEYNQQVHSVGFSTYDGTVTAASQWGGVARSKTINPGLESSYEDLFHNMDKSNFFINLRNDKEIDHYLSLPRLQRAIGVIYRPDSERVSHYFLTKLPMQFDTIIHIDHTNALVPLDINPEWKKS